MNMDIDDVDMNGGGVSSSNVGEQGGAVNAGFSYAAAAAAAPAQQVSAMAVQAHAQVQQQQQQRAAGDDDDAMGMEVDEDAAGAVPDFPQMSQAELSGAPSRMAVQIPPNRLSPLKQHWMEIYTPIVEHMQLQIRFNPKRNRVEMQTSEHTKLATALQKSADFVRAFALGFAVRDAIALLRLDDLYIDSFEIKDVRTLQGEHLSRAIGRIAGVGGKTKHTIENATKTRIVLADTKIHILGAYANINIAKDAIVRLIRGTPPGKVYTHMRNVAARMKDRF